MTPYLQQHALYPPLVETRPSPSLGLVVTVPACDEPQLLLSLKSLERCALPQCDVEVLVLINHSEAAEPELRQRSLEQYEQLTAWARTAGRRALRFHILYLPDLPKRHAGVGLARKILMDEACFRFAKTVEGGVEVGRDGIIACFDADALVEPNYFQALEQYFIENTKQDACSIRFAHPLKGSDFPPEVYEAIAQYELHLRVYLQWQRWAGFPHAFHTIGSSMAVRAKAYQQQGGMNKRQAGEDFYFLQKFIEIGRLGELCDTCVVPSPRLSNRVPFGTGRSVGELLKASPPVYFTYHPKSFFMLRDLYEAVPSLYEGGTDSLARILNPVLLDFLREQDGGAAFRQIRSNVATAEAFCKRFFRWFSAFRQMKFLHYARERGYPDRPVVEVALQFLKTASLPIPEQVNAKKLLRLFRSLECNFAASD